ncbi:MAG: TetR/AcrR family transcriptional regulator [Polyangiaceae bacterium]|nr:TetR/AcrR family transcriptional regulator [Polyangiaceae bacterium]
MPRVADRRVKIDLLRAAEAAFTERGLAGARVEDITARAGVSKGSFYLHFKSKEDCFQQIVEGFLARLAACIEPLMDRFEGGADETGELIARMHEHDAAVLEFCWQNRALLRMVLLGGGGAPYAYLIDEFAARVAQQAEQRVRSCVLAGLYRADVDPAIVAVLISGAYDRLVRELIQRERRPDIAAWCAQAIDLFTLGTLTPEARAVRDREVTKAPEGAA